MEEKELQQSVASAEPAPVEILDETMPIEPEAPTEEPKVAPKEPDKDWRELRAMRERALKAEQERDEIIRQLQQKQPEPQKEEDLNININSDDLVEGKHIATLQKQYRKLEEKLAKYEQQSSTQTTEIRLKAELPDFDAVVTKENIELLRASEPELADSIASSTDLYVKAKAAYRAIKRLGILPDESLVQDKARIARNAAKPVPTAAISKTAASPLSQVNMFENGITEDVRKALYKEMMQAINGN